MNLPAPVFAELVRDAQARDPYEACGIVVSRDGVPTDAWPFANLVGQHKRRWGFSRQVLLRAAIDARRQGKKIWAIYHSHVDSEARPSPRDIEGAFTRTPDGVLPLYCETEAVMLIVGLQPAPHVRGWYIRYLEGPDDYVCEEVDPG